MPNSAESNKQRIRLSPARLDRARAVMARPLSQSAVSSAPPSIASKRIQPVDPATPHRTQMPAEYPSVESRALSTFDDNPLFGTCEAAEFLAVGVDLLKKWRRRNQGPDYVQYGPGGPVRYELDALMAFRARHRVRVSSKP
jgi:hypothetical protein